MSRPKIGYTILTGVNKIIELLSRIAPELPTEDGGYTMQVYMSDGEATYVWGEGVHGTLTATADNGTVTLSVV